jgi:hypothetical protein
MALYLAAGGRSSVFRRSARPAWRASATGGCLIDVSRRHVSVLSQRTTSLAAAGWLVSQGSPSFTSGIAQLTLISGSVGRALQLGVTPFATLDVVRRLSPPITVPRSARRDS